MRNPFRQPDDKEIACRQLLQARMNLLHAEAEKEAWTHHVNMLCERIARLEAYVRADGTGWACPVRTSSNGTASR